MIDYLERYCPASTLEIPKASGGMFLWIRVRVDTHPKFHELSPDTIGKRVFEALIGEKVLVAPGHFFKAPRVRHMTPEEEASKVFMRLSYALPPLDQMEEGVKRIGRALRREWEL